MRARIVLFVDKALILRWLFAFDIITQNFFIIAITILKWRIFVVISVVLLHLLTILLRIRYPDLTSIVNIKCLFPLAVTRYYTAMNAQSLTTS